MRGLFSTRAGSRRGVRAQWYTSLGSVSNSKSRSCCWDGTRGPRRARAITSRASAPRERSAPIRPSHEMAWSTPGLIHRSSAGEGGWIGGAGRTTGGSKPTSPRVQHREADTASRAASVLPSLTLGSGLARARGSPAFRKQSAPRSAAARSRSTPRRWPRVGRGGAADGTKPVTTSSGDFLESSRGGPARSAATKARSQRGALALQAASMSEAVNGFEDGCSALKMS
mmetsp:Transcript_63765/g.201671  ORF Transcript_63765/g.201671 Transcript_63765/m.201671 type:complete len:227 (+) Transcript_63765:589-1269(+)